MTVAVIMARDINVLTISLPKSIQTNYSSTISAVDLQQANDQREVDCTASIKRKPYRNLDLTLFGCYPDIVISTYARHHGLTCPPSGGSACNLVVIWKRNPRGQGKGKSIHDVLKYHRW